MIDINIPQRINGCIGPQGSNCDAKMLTLKAPLLSWSPRIPVPYRLLAQDFVSCPYATLSPGANLRPFYIAASSRYISVLRWPEIYHSHVLLHSRPSISVLCSCLRSHFVSCLYANMSCSAFYRGLFQSNAAIPMLCFWPRIHFVSYPYTNQSSDADLGLAIRAQS